MQAKAFIQHLSQLLSLEQRTRGELTFFEMHRRQHHSNQRPSAEGTRLQEMLRFRYVVDLVLGVEGGAG